MLEKTFYKTLLSRSFKNVPVKVVFWDHSTATWFPVNKIDNLNRDFFVLCHD